MIFSTYITPQAKEDIIDSRNYYNNKISGLGTRFVSSVKDSIDLITEHPELFAERHNNTRTAPVKDFPFLIHYGVNSNKHLIILLAIIHTARNPENWPK